MNEIVYVVTSTTPDSTAVMGVYTSLDRAEHVAQRLVLEQWGDFPREIIRNFIGTVFFCDADDEYYVEVLRVHLDN